MTFAVVGIVAMAAGVLLATHQRWDTGGCTLGTPCDPALRFPYFIPGAASFAVGLFMELAGATIALRLWLARKRIGSRESA